LHENLTKYGKSYTFHIGGLRKGILTTEPAFIQHVLQKNHRNYRKSKLQTYFLARYVGRGLLTSDGAFWLRQRRMIQPAFHRTQLNRLVGIIAEEVDRFFRLHWTSTGTRDIYEDMHTLAFRIVAKALFSADIEGDVLRKLSQQISRLQWFITQRIRKPYLHQWYYVSGQIRKHDKVAAEARSTILGIIRERKRSGERKNDLLDLLLSARYEDTGLPMDETQILDESLILFVAGHETTANALTWTLFLSASTRDISRISARS